MLTIQLIRENPDFVVKRLAIKNFDATDAVKKILSLDEKRVAIQQELNAKQAEINSLSKEIGTLFAQKKVDEANAAKLRQTANPAAEHAKAHWVILLFSL